MAPLIPIAYILLAIGSSSGRSGRRGGRGAGRGRGRGANKTSTTTSRGRKRYTRDGIKKRPSNNNDDNRQEELYPLPSLTVPNGPRPSYYTCRHSYEDTLIDEINRFVDTSCDGKVITSSPYPGLVRVQDDDSILPALYDPVYA